MPQKECGKRVRSLLFIFGTLSVTFWSLFLMLCHFFRHFFAKLLLPDSFCGRVKNHWERRGKTPKKKNKEILQKGREGRSGHCRQFQHLSSQFPSQESNHVDDCRCCFAPYLLGKIFRVMLSQILVAYSLSLLEAFVNSHRILVSFSQDEVHFHQFWSAFIMSCRTEMHKIS